MGHCLERQGLLEQDTESAWLDLDPTEDTDAMPQILGSSISYRVAVGPQQGRKAFMIRTLRPLERPDPGVGASSKGQRLLPACRCELRRKSKSQARTIMPLHRPPSGGRSASVGQFHWQGGLLPEGAR